MNITLGITLSIYPLSFHFPLAGPGASHRVEKKKEARVVVVMMVTA